MAYRQFSTELVLVLSLARLTLGVSVTSPLIALGEIRHIGGKVVLAFGLIRTDELPDDDQPFV